MVGILVSFWDGLFSGAMLVSGRVKIDTSHHSSIFGVPCELRNVGNPENLAGQLLQFILSKVCVKDVFWKFPGWTSHYFSVLHLRIWMLTPSPDVTAACASAYNV